MGNTHILTVLAATLAIGATTAGAATLNFYEEAFGNERGVASGDTLNTANTGNIDVILSGTSNGQAANPYLDSGGALGVCGSGLTTSVPLNQCSNPSDDNVKSGQALTIAFNTAMDVSGLWFIADGHGSTKGNYSLLTGTDTLLVTTSNMAIATYTFANLIAASFSNVTSLTFGYGGTAAKQFYLGGAVATPSAVPVPAAGFLLLGGLGMLGFGARRRKNRAA